MKTLKLILFTLAVVYSTPLAEVSEDRLPLDFDDTNIDYDELDFSRDEQASHQDGDDMNFLPKNMLSFELDEGKEECFFQDIETTPATIRGAWFLSTSGTPSVHLIVKFIPPGRSSKNKILLEEDEEGKDSGQFQFEAQLKGSYSFCFFNENAAENQILTFSLEVVYQRATVTSRSKTNGGVAMPEHVNKLRELTKDLRSTIESLQQELEVVLLRFNQHAESQDFAEERVSFFTLLESVAILFMTAGQIYYVRRLVNRSKQWV